MGDALAIYNFLMDNSIPIAVILALFVSIGFRGAALLRWIRKRLLGRRTDPPKNGDGP
ncbi:MAG: hypothetical protein AAGN35_17815 [Bacteroidota bacterium]